MNNSDHWRMFQDEHYGNHGRTKTHYSRLVLLKGPPYSRMRKGEEEKEENAK